MLTSYENIHKEKSETIPIHRYANFNAEKKGPDIRSLLQHEFELGQKLEREAEFKLYLLTFLGITIVLVLVFFRGYRERMKANRRLSRAYAEIENKNKDMSDSITYARQIQKARLPDPELILEAFSEAFGLYKPKDIVSGDFYWFAHTKSGKVILAAADCTGHGIPGAFMSLIGMDILNYAVIENQLSNPTEILECVNISMKKAMKQKDESSGTRDGMDIVLCVFDFEEMELSYAGAHRPLVVVRKGEVTEYKPTKQAIGGLTADDQVFETQKICLRKNDMVYLFSDGYSDQFGGPRNKKFSSRKFKDLLSRIYSLPACTQENLLEQTFENWRENNDQLDDVLVMGVRI